MQVYMQVYRSRWFSLVNAELSSARSFSILLHCVGFSDVVIDTNGRDSTTVVKFSFVQLFCIADSVIDKAVSCVS